MELPERLDGIITLEDEGELDEQRMRVRVIFILVLLAAVLVIALAINGLSQVEGVPRWTL